MKKVMNCVLAGALAISMLPIAAHANFSVTNMTHFYATADAHNTKTGFKSACSSAVLGDVGRIKPVEQAPNNHFDIPTGAIGFFCSPNCDVTVYMSKDCDARKIAVVPISPDKGIGEPVNLPNAEGIYISKKNNNEVTIEGGPKAAIFDLMFRKLGI